MPRGLSPQTPPPHIDLKATTLPIALQARRLLDPPGSKPHLSPQPSQYPSPGWHGGWVEPRGRLRSVHVFVLLVISAVRICVCKPLRGLCGLLCPFYALYVPQGQ